MGYSCSKAADDTLKNIQASFRVRNSGNAFSDGKHELFWEIGRENTDGAITGKVWLSMSDTTARPAGSFRIDPDGTVVRFPGVPRKHWDYMKRMDEATRARLKSF
jgi:hypothetical protein